MHPASDRRFVEAPSGRQVLGSGDERKAGLRIDGTFELDTSYRDILGDRAWYELKAEIRERFSLKPGNNSRIHYQGTMHTIHLSFMGWLFAQLCRLIGMPLAPYRGRDVPMEIILEPDDGGVAWIRVYKFARPGEVVARSTKKRGKSNDLVEHIGCGFSMSLALQVREGDLFFISRSYNLKIAKLEIRIPDILTPGRTTVSHEQLGGNRFRFTLSVEHPLFGRTIFQEGVFE